VGVEAFLEVPMSKKHRILHAVARAQEQAPELAPEQLPVPEPARALAPAPAAAKSYRCRCGVTSNEGGVYRVYSAGDVVQLPGLAAARIADALEELPEGE